ncbi:MAG: DNA translocase FtsK [Acidobacteria bacterium]|nr:DNA translocase FtsK [Acidobacteriota bacterium]
MAAAFFLVSLFSYDAADSDLFVHLADSPADNLGGRVGATFAALGFQLLGLGAWSAAIACGSFGWFRFRSREIPAAFTKVVGCSTLLIFGCILVHYLLGAISLGGTPAPAGGILGAWGGDALLSSFGPVGGPLVAVTAFLLSLVAVTKLSLARLALAIWNFLVSSSRHLRTTATRWREQRRKTRQRAAVIKKYTAKATKTPKGIAVDDEAQAPAEPGALLTLKVPVKNKRPGAPVPEPATEEMASLEPVIETTAAMADPEPLPFEQPAGPDGDYALPEYDLLTTASGNVAINQKELMEKAQAITSKAAEFRVTGEVVAIHPGPVVTTFEFRPGTGVKYSRITNLEEDLSLALKAESIRIARLPGKATVGIEVPNNDRLTIAFRDIVESQEFTNHKSKLALAVGKQIHGETIITDLARMPHLLIAGTTGAGKSVALNSMLLSLLYKATPDEVKLVLIDPKRLEFGLYEDIPHLLTPVVVEPKLAANALSWAVREMERRYKLLAEYGVRNIDQFNLILKRGGEELSEIDTEDIKPLPYIVVIIDELADLMMTASNVVEEAIIRLSQMARAVGIHLILATQRPSVDVLTGVIKNNLPARMSFRVASKVDSRVILDTQGAETLLGKGDMLFLAPGTSRISRVHGAFVTEEEVKGVVRFWRDQARPAYTEEVTKAPPEAAKKGKGDQKRDEYFADAVRVVVTAGEASVSNIQRKLSLGYARAGRIMDAMESEGIVGPAQGSKPRRVLVDASYVDHL